MKQFLLFILIPGMTAILFHSCKDNSSNPLAIHPDLPLV